MSKHLALKNELIILSKDILLSLTPGFLILSASVTCETFFSYFGAEVYCNVINYTNFPIAPINAILFLYLWLQRIRQRRVESIGINWLVEFAKLVFGQILVLAPTFLFFLILLDGPL